MDTNQPTTSTTTTYVAPPPKPGMFGTKIPSSVAFVVGLLLFLLPFAEIRCAGTKLATKSGLDFALDNKWKPLGGGLMGKNETADQSFSSGKEQKGNTQYLIIGAFGLGLIGLFLSLAGGKSGGVGGIVTGVLGAGALIGFMLDLKKNVSNSLREQALDKAKEGADNLGLDKLGNGMGDMTPTLAFSPWFYIAVVAFLAAAFFCYKRMQSSKT
jgi:hypothetical protein